MILVMENKAMTSDDTYDTLKYGHVPVDHLLEYAKTKNFDFSNFSLDLDSNLYYNASCSLLHDGDAYDISCFINYPNIEEDEHKVTVNFYCDMRLIDDKEYLPYFPNYHSEHFTIDTREQFVNILDFDWKIFVQTSIGMILYHNQEILSELDVIIENNYKLHIKRNSTKNDWLRCMNEISTHLTNNVKSVVDFQKVPDWADKYQKI